MAQESHLENQEADAERETADARTAFDDLDDGREEYLGDKEYCDHDNYDIDVCTGRAECDQCGTSWYVTGQEVDAELDRQVAYDAECEKWERAERWNRFKSFVRSLFCWPRKSKLINDDEIPF